jgi:hypothetical protein
MDISLVQGFTSVVLNGTGGAVPLRAGKIDLSTAGVVVVECALDGTAAQIATFQQSVERVLMLGQLYAGLPGEDWAYVQVTLPDASQWRTPILAGACEAMPGPGSRVHGSQGLRVRLRVEAWWEGVTLLEAPLSNTYGALVTGGTVCDNHYDTGHMNYFSIASSTILGDVPAPAVLTISNSLNGMEFFLGQCVTNDVANFNGMREGEQIFRHTFGGYAATADANCSNGNYGAYTWNGTGKVDAAWTMSATLSQQWAGRVYRPVLRLRDLIAGGEKIYAWFTLAFEGTGTDVMVQCEGVVLPTDRKLVVFPPMALPPWPRPPSGFAWEAWHLQIALQAEGAGAHAFNFDFVQMLPTEGWLRFYPVMANLTYSNIRYDCGTGQISRALTGAVSHVPEGPGILLYPAVQQKIFMLAQNAAGMDIAALLGLKVQYRPRKRVL